LQDTCTCRLPRRQYTAATAYVPVCPGRCSAHTRKHATCRRLARRGHGDALAVKLKKQSVNCLRSKANDTTSHHSRTSSIRFCVLLLQLATVGASAAKKSGQRLNCCIGCEYTHSNLHDRADRGLKRHSVGVGVGVGGSRHALRRQSWADRAQSSSPSL
jgi:hypothetical protein